MVISEKIMNSKLTPSEKIALAYILKGNKRYKYIPREKLASVLFVSEGQATNIFKRLQELKLIMWVRKSGKNYKIVIVCQEAFNRYADIYDRSDIDEGTYYIKDEYIQMLGKIESDKPLYLSNNIKGKKLKELAEKVFGSK